MNKITLILFLVFMVFFKEPLIAESTISDSTSTENTQNPLSKIPEKMLYFEAGSLFKSLSLLTQLGRVVSPIVSKGSSLDRELLLFDELCNYVSSLFFLRMFSEEPIQKYPGLSSKIPHSHSSWYINQIQLSKIPTFSQEDKELLFFLQNRWLAKATGFFSPLIDWVYPCFGVSVQIHPETTHSYARSPSIKFSQTYNNKVAEWKQSLPQPSNFPLILTRPFDLRDYLPSYFEILPSEEIYTIAKKLALKIKSIPSKIFVDFSSIFPKDLKDPDKWLQIWIPYQTSFSKACKEFNIDQDRIICILKEKQKNIGGIRILPLTSLKQSELDHQFLVQWLSTFGLSANRIELDRFSLSSNTLISTQETSNIPIQFLSKEEFISYLTNFDQNRKTSHPQKDLLLKGTLLVLNGLLATLSEDSWGKIYSCPTKSAIAELSFFNIKKQFQLIEQTESSITFFTFTSYIEQIHANLSSLIEIFSPFTDNNFSIIYQKALKLLPQNLKQLTSYGIHSSAMTTVAGILQIAKKMLGKSPNILYGENTYFECINAAKLVSKASSILEATESDLQEADLLFAQFNPVWKGTHLQKNKYGIEAISENLHKCLNNRSDKALTLALDCTFDLINSPKVSQLLHEFQGEIEQGILNIICYRSGLKFDLFGMDNYCGAPFYMIHNDDKKWMCFDALIKDPVLQTDQLSLNWFCLAYQNAPTQLELYQKQIIENTKNLLNKIPKRLFSYQNTNYRVIPMQQEINPIFIDITVLGPLHSIKAAAIVGGYLSLECVKKGFPIFYRISTGFYHTNLTMLFDEECSSIRLTLGLDPDQVDILAQCFEKIDALNGEPIKVP